MKTNNRSSRFAAVALLTVLAACPVRDADPVLDAEALPEQPQRDPAAMPEATQAIALEPLPGAAVSAEAQLMPIGTETQLVLNVRNATPGTTLFAHVLTGSCDAAGPVAADLPPITPDAQGRGSSRTVIGVAPATFFNGNHFVLLVERVADDEQAVGCGEIPHHPHRTPQPVGTAPGAG